MCHQFLCAVPPALEVEVDENGKYFPGGKRTTIDRFSVGALTGIEMALDAFRMKNAWFKEFAMHDRVTFLCYEVQKSDDPKMSDMPQFEISIER